MVNQTLCRGTASTTLRRASIEPLGNQAMASLFLNRMASACNIFLPRLEYRSLSGEKTPLSHLRGCRFLLIHVRADALRKSEVRQEIALITELCKGSALETQVVVSGDCELADLDLQGVLAVNEPGDHFLKLAASLPLSCDLDYLCFVDESWKICWVMPQLSSEGLPDLLEQIGSKVFGREIPDMRAPVLLVDNVFTPAQCDDIIAHFNARTSSRSKVGDVVNTASKIRDDVFLSAEASGAIDAVVTRSLLPELQRAFGFVGSHRETYKVGCYRGGEGGFYRPHRDKYRGPNLKEQAYRQYSYTINLNQEFEGGGIYFPEFSSNYYKVPRGGAIVFPSHLLHAVYPVTSGDRYILVGFVFDENAQRMRKAHLRDFDPERAEERLVRPYAIDSQLMVDYGIYRESLERISPTLTIPSPLIKRFETGEL